MMCSHRRIFHDFTGEPGSSIMTIMGSFILSTTVGLLSILSAQAFGSFVVSLSHQSTLFKNLPATLKLGGEQTSATTKAEIAVPFIDCCNGNFWAWKDQWNIHYVTAGTQGPPVLLVPGFGVGTFHFDRNIPELAANSHRVWALDLLGQGKSWPQDGTEDGLTYSVETWTDQLIDFIENIIGEPTYLAGNSLGGLLSVAVAAKRPDLVKGLMLLNATPFWAFLPAKSKTPEWAEPLLPWDGVLPAPEPYFKFGSFYFDQLRNQATVRTMLEFVYTSPKSLNKELVDNIIAATNRGKGHAAFTSIVFARKPDSDFDEDLQKLKCPVCLIYGKEDPWVVPLWGQKIKRQIPDATYFEISPSGHCPHHETPEAANTLIMKCIESMETGHAIEDSYEFTTLEETTGQLATASKVDGKPRNVFEWVQCMIDLNSV
mmetsp:Transcript_7074/g.9474  ORF Transcript_7074/g.9474 Transcript_7074/m.9474 type:complete len:430 (+) Transcript_7074:81-1370(+)